MSRSLLDLFKAANEAGVKLEMTAGIPTWEAFPALRHQRIVDRIRASIRPAPGFEGACGCFSEAAIYIQFPDGSLKRPDISIFGTEPPETDEALLEIPAAVVEIVSRGYEQKDRDLSPPFYLGQGVQDLVVVDPYQREALHFTSLETRVYELPSTVRLKVGCEVSV